MKTKHINKLLNKHQNLPQNKKVQAQLRQASYPSLLAQDPYGNTIELAASDIDTLAAIANDAGQNCNLTASKNPDCDQSQWVLDSGSCNPCNPILAAGTQVPSTGTVQVNSRFLAYSCGNTTSQLKESLDCITTTVRNDCKSVCDENTTKGLIIFGGVVGGLAGLGLLCCLFSTCRKPRQRTSQENTNVYQSVVEPPATENQTHASVTASTPTLSASGHS